MADDTSRLDMTRRETLSGIATIGAMGTVAGLGAATGRGNSKRDTTQLTVRIENVASLDQYPTAPDPPLSTGGTVWITPGAYGIYKGQNLVLSRNKPASSGLEAIAEAGRPGGTNLHEGDAPVDGSVTGDVYLWDAGTEPNEAPSSDSLNQAPRQGLEFGNPDKGPDEGGVVRELRPTDKVNDGYSYPDPSEAIDVTLTPQ